MWPFKKTEKINQDIKLHSNYYERYSDYLEAMKCPLCGIIDDSSRVDDKNSQCVVKLCPGCGNYTQYEVVVGRWHCMVNFCGDTFGKHFVEKGA